MVPGSVLRGAAPGAAPVTDEGMAALKQRAAQVMPDVAVAADVNGIEPLPDGRFVVTLRDGTMTVIEIRLFGSRTMMSRGCSPTRRATSASGRARRTAST